MKTIIYILGLLSFLIAPISAKAVQDPRNAPDVEVWVMSIQICKDLPPQVQDAINRGIVFMPWMQLQSQSCKWFGVGTTNLMSPQDESELAAWPTYQDCVDAPINIPEGFTLKKRHCQPIVEYNPDIPRRRN